LAKQADPFDYVRDWDRRLSREGWWHSFELRDGTLIQGVCDLPGLKNRIAQFPIPEDLRGKRVLDIGTWDGWFSFEMERRGADVVAIDCWDNPRFREMHARLDSRVRYLQMDVYELEPKTIGRFDIVLFMGVLYHLKHPLLALERVCSVTSDLAAVDSFVLQEKHRPGANVEHRPIMEFYETDEFGGQTDNWAGPSLLCLTAFCRTAGFARVEVRNVLTNSACIACYRSWEPPPAHLKEPPDLKDVFHHTNYGINFNTRYDEYLTCWFDSPHLRLTLDDVKPEVSGYGVRPIHVRNTGHWQANFKLPPGLTSGWHNVRIRVKDSDWSRPKAIAVDLPLEAALLRITGTADGQTWKPNQIDLEKGYVLAIWVLGLPPNADRSNVKVALQGRNLNVTYVEPHTGEDRPRQVNTEVPDSAPVGALEVVAEVGTRRSPPETVEVLGHLRLPG
jgi:tRNA (mo5U34)-methyltransferase